MKVNKYFAKRNTEVTQLKIAFLIMAHNNVELLNDFIQQILRYDKSDIFVHVDKKAENMIPQIKKAGRIHILKQHIDAAWGDYTQIEMIHLLLDEAYRFGEYDYYSLHSGVDMLIKPVNDLVEYLSKTRKYGYYDCSKLPAKNWGHGGGLERISLKYPQIFRKRYQPQHPIRYIRAMYQMLYQYGIMKGKKLPEKYTFYGGSEWFTVSKQCVERYFNFIKNNQEYDELFHKALMGDEIYFLSIFEMTRKEAVAEEKNCLTYIDWKQRGQKNGSGSPNNMSMNFLSEIENSGMFFARKFNPDFDSEVIQYFLNKTL
jgi:hypothetical protein